MVSYVFSGHTDNLLLCKSNEQWSKRMSCWPINRLSPAAHWPKEMTLLPHKCWMWCTLGVAHCFCHQYRGFHFIIVLLGIPLHFHTLLTSYSALYVNGKRVWGPERPEQSARLTDRLAVPSAAPSTLWLHCSILSGRSAGRLLTIVSSGPATWHRGGKRLPPSPVERRCRLFMCT